MKLNTLSKPHGVTLGRTLIVLGVTIVLACVVGLFPVKQDDNGIYAYPPDATLLMGECLIFNESPEIPDSWYRETLEQMLIDRSEFYERNPPNKLE